MNKFDLTGRKALVTGGARGLGEGMAQALAAAGASVMIGDVLTSLGKETAGKLPVTGGAKAGFVKLDVTQEADWQAAVKATVDTLGGTYEGVQVIFTDVKRENWATGGRLASDPPKG